MKWEEWLLKNPAKLEKLPINLTVEIANKEISIQEMLELVENSGFVFDETLDSPLNLTVEGYKVAEGIIVKIKDRYGIKVTKILKELETFQK